MFLLIAFLGGMVSLLSPCTLPVIPLLFAGFRGQKRQLIAMLFGMVIMFTLVASLIAVASDWVVSATIVGRWIALALLSLAALALIFPPFAQRIAGPHYVSAMRSIPGAAAPGASPRQCSPGWRSGCCGRRAPGRCWGPFSA